MLGKLHIRQWTASASQNKVSLAVDTTHKAKGAGKYYKILMKATELNNISTLCSQGKKEFNDLSLAWMDKGTRIFTVETVYDAMTSLSAFKAEVQEAIRDFVDAYPELVKDQEKRLGDLYDVRDYPPVDSITKRFDFGYSFWPIPQTGDWRVEMTAEAIQEIKTTMEQRLKEAHDTAMENLWDRLHEAVEELRVKVANLDYNFHNSLFENNRELVKLLPKLNIGNDQALLVVCDEFSQIVAKDPATVRGDENIRGQVSTDARNLLAKLEGHVQKEAA